LRRYTSCFITEAVIHPDIEILISYCDGELTPGQFASVAEHLASCDSCAVECDRLRAARDTPHAPLPPQALEALRGRLQELIAERARPQRSGEIQQRLVSALAPFLGPLAAGRLLFPASASGRDLLPIVEPVLASFLGKRAAAELVGHLIDTTMGDA
jgi:anti-sigma factor RsiW